MSTVKKTFKNAHIFIAPNATAKVWVVADNTARDLLSPASGDYAYMLDRTSAWIDKYSGAAWAASTEMDYCVTDLDFSEVFDVVEQTDSCTTGDTTESKTTNAEAQASFTRILRDSGADKMVAKAGSLQYTHDGSVVPVSSVVLTQTYSEIDVTDSSSDPNTKEYVVDRVKQTLDLTHIVQGDDVDLPRNEVVTFEVEFQDSPQADYAGSVELNSFQVGASNGSEIPVTYNGEIQGAVAFTGIDAMFTAARGYVFALSDGKTYSGAGGGTTVGVLQTARTINATIGDNITSEETLRINGTIAKTNE